MLLTCTVFALGELQHMYLDRRNLPDTGPLMRFELSSVGHVYDAKGESLVEFTREYRQVTTYDELPPVVRNAILATEDKRFFKHNGVDFLAIPRVLTKIRLGHWNSPLAFPQGGSTITQQLVRGVFLEEWTAQERRNQLRSRNLLARIAAVFLGNSNTNRILRKREEIRLSIWLERQMRREYGSKRRAKEEILARYASFVYMGKGQYGFANASQYYFGRPLSSLTANDADIAAALAGVMKAPRDYAPTATNSASVIERRNVVLALMASRGFLSQSQKASFQQRPLKAVVEHTAAKPLPVFPASAVVEHVIDELTLADPDLGLDDLLHGRVQVYTTADARIQRILADALEHGLKRYEDRHPKSRGLIQGSAVVLSNRDGSILAEAGGRQIYRGQRSNYGDLNRVRRSLRQPGSTMKPIVYLAALRTGAYTLDTIVPDEPISVPGARPNQFKSISNYDGVFKGPIAMRKALAESRNAVAVWLASQIGISAVLSTARNLGVETPLQPYVTTALGASEMNLLELATAYRTIATGVAVQPHIVQRIVTGFENSIDGPTPATSLAPIGDTALAEIQEGLRGVVLLPSGTAHSLASLPIPVMGKTGTTSDFKDALFVGSTYGVNGITVAIRIGFDDNRTLGGGETGGRAALPVFQEVVTGVYKILGSAPDFPEGMDQNIKSFVVAEAVAAANARLAAETDAVNSLVSSDPAAVLAAAGPIMELPKKCAHVDCKCVIPREGALGPYCSDRCRNAIPGAHCDCQHPACIK
jgi:penicillin-binding protein 1A